MSMPKWTGRWDCTARHEMLQWAADDRENESGVSGMMDQHVLHAARVMVFVPKLDGVSFRGFLSLPKPDALYSGPLAMSPPCLPRSLPLYLFLLLPLRHCLTVILAVFVLGAFSETL